MLLRCFHQRKNLKTLAILYSHIELHDLFLYYCDINSAVRLPEKSAATVSDDICFLTYSSPCYRDMMEIGTVWKGAITKIWEDKNGSYLGGWTYGVRNGWGLQTYSRDIKCFFSSNNRQLFGPHKTLIGLQNEINHSYTDDH